MIADLEARGIAAAAAARRRTVARVLAALGEVPGVAAEADVDGVVAKGRRLRRRWLTDARLRWIGGWL